MGEERQTEEWKQVEGTPYYISSWGRVRRPKYGHEDEWSYVKPFEQLYHYVTFSYDGKR